MTKALAARGCLINRWGSNLGGYHYPSPAFHQDITSLNKLITATSKAGDLASAEKIFNHIDRRDVVSWNSIMSSYAWHGRYEKVQKVFLEMHNHGFTPNHTSISTVLSACSKLRALAQGRKIHGLAVKTCSTRNVFVGTSLITMYSNCGSDNCLIQVFKEIDCPNIASWNALISGFVLNLQIDDARQVFNMMPVRNVVSWTSMIHGYTEIKKVRDALSLFNLMPVKNSVTWSMMVGGLASNGMNKEAIKIFTRMIWNGIRSTAASIISVINASSGLKNVKQGRKFHGHVIKVGFHNYESIEASLISMYCRCLNAEETMQEFRKMESKFICSYNSLLHGLISNGKVDQARMLFDDMDEHDQISWNLMINGYVKNKQRDAAFELYLKMQEPTVETTTTLMMSFIHDGLLHEAQKLFNMMPEVDVVAYTTLISGYLEYGFIDKAMELFRKMPERNVVTYNVMISGFLKHGKISEAYDMFSECSMHDTSTWDALIIGFVHNGLLAEAFLHYKKMLLSTIRPSELVIATLLSASSKLSVLIHGQQIHSVAIKLGHDSHMVVENSLLNMYFKFGDVLSAKETFDQMTIQDVVTWNAMIYGYACNGFGKNAIKMFEDMRATDIKPDHVTFIGLLSACNQIGLLERAQYYFNLMWQECGMKPNLEHYACIVGLLSRMGMVEQAERFISSMPCQPDSKIWTSVLSGCRSTCNIKLAKHAAEELLTWNPSDPMPLLHLIDVYASAGRWDDIVKLRKQIDDRQSNKLAGCSWI